MNNKNLAMPHMLEGYAEFREKYAAGDASVMQKLAYDGQKPQLLIVGCCDSRVDPSVILQSEPGELFIVRNVANIVPPYDSNEIYRSTVAALEFGICHLNIPHLVIWGHSQCGGIQAMLDKQKISSHDDYISRWVSLIAEPNMSSAAGDVDTAAQQALQRSYQNCLSYPWIKERVDDNQLVLHRWFIDISQGQLMTYSDNKGWIEA